MSSQWLDLSPTSHVLPATAVKASVSSASTDAEIPSAKCLNDLLGGVEQALDVINNGDATPQWWGLRIQAEEDDADVSMVKVGTPDAASLLYSLDDGKTWTSFDADGGTIVNLTHAGDYVCFKAGVSGNTKISKSYDDYRKFTLSKKCGAYGNIMSLLDGTDNNSATAATMDTYCFRSLFRECANLTSAPLLPAAIVPSYGYDNMFRDCTSLTVAPALPALHLSALCYRSLFWGCTALSTPPAILPATQLKTNCYVYMFNGCSSLTSIPELPAVVMAESCYDNMFAGCTGLVEIPYLPATVMSAYSCRSMFYGCSKLEGASLAVASGAPYACNYMFYNCANLRLLAVKSKDWDSYWSYSWVSGVAGTGNFMCPAVLGTNATIQRGSDRCPSNWTVTNYVNEPVKFTAQEAGSTISMARHKSPTKTVTLQYSLDNGTTWQSFVIESTTVTLQSVGDSVLFKAGAEGNQAGFGDSSGNSYEFVMTGKISASGNAMSLLSESLTHMPSYGFVGLFRDCTALTTPPELPSPYIREYCYWSMFYGCTSLAAAPELPAGNIQYSDGCYLWMFANCSSLIKAPALKSTERANVCYYSMFNGCTSLKSAEIHMGSGGLTDPMAGMFGGCSSLEEIIIPNLDAWATPNNKITTTDWLLNASATGILKCPKALGTNETITRGTSYCPDGWTVVNI